MNWEAYTESVERTTGIPPFDLPNSLIMACFGLAGETGEVLDYVKKHLFHNHPLRNEVMLDELGDVLWYWTLLCMVLGFTPEEVMAENMHKLRRRYPEGFSSERSINREP